MARGDPMTFPIPDAALDDRLAFLGTAGSGKTYGSGTAVERLLTAAAKVVIVDPLGVWWGLRLQADGKARGFDLPIFGGQHGDLPLNESAGKLIGETVASMRESCIVDLSALNTKEAERRFMLAFLEALYRHAGGDPMHAVFDEADLWAPQSPSKQGAGQQLQSLMEQIVRRGRAVQKASPATAWPDQRQLVQSLTDELAETSTALERLTASAKELQRRHKLASAALGGESIEIPAVTAPQRRVALAPVPAQRQPAPPREQPEGDGSVPSGCNKPLAALAGAYPAGMTESQWSMVAG